MSRISLYTGGSRSGKSRAAVDFAQAQDAPVCFIATCDPQDEEMRTRVQRHREERPENWQVIEEALNIAEQLSLIDAQQFPVVIVDCLTLWISNKMFCADAPLVTESAVVELAEELISAARHYGGHVIFVTNEVGLGVIPDNALARRFSDIAGRCNQTIASAADDVVFYTCGLPLNVKGGQS